jgi:hypothetical protein
MLSGPEILCARCSKKPLADFHKIKVRSAKTVILS